MSDGRRTVRKRPAGRRRTRSTIPLLLAAAVVIVLAGGYLVASRWPGSSGGPISSAAAVPPSSRAAGTPILTVSPAVYDLGRISQARGIVTVELAVANTGAGDLIIPEMETSCGCTRAALVVDGKTGPWFGMRGHGEWPTGWSARLHPNQRATLRVQYDPDAHGIFRGPIDRIVAIYSNDPNRPQAEVRLTGTQVP